MSHESQRDDETPGCGNHGEGEGGCCGGGKHEDHERQGGCCGGNVKQEQKPGGCGCGCGH